MKGCAFVLLCVWRENNFYLRAFFVAQKVRISAQGSDI